MDLMRESPFAQYLTQQAREEGIEQGERKYAIEQASVARRYFWDDQAVMQGAGKHLEGLGWNLFYPS